MNREYIEEINGVKYLMIDLTPPEVCTIIQLQENEES